MSSMEGLSPAIHPFLACPVARVRQLEAFMPSMDSRMRPGVAFTRSMEELSCSDDALVVMRRAAAARARRQRLQELVEGALGLRGRRGAVLAVRTDRLD